ncbi:MULTISPECIES: hypothetical protein [Streptococcus]|uniref:hypothetical protein n=1 Tax=Streptococcus TaxID=1301 RepID=UPI001551FBB1|nr:hypothetical protein [Streptococcus suis]MCL4921836.1 hypothetical protein [Streptococcus suis]NQP30736.1 hypothetical protein [Streptococcus suis]
MSSTFKLKGLDKFQRDLKRKAKSVSGNYSFDELFPDSYIRSISRFSSLSEMFENNPEKITDAESFKQANQEILDQFISEETKFSNWQEMLNDAGAKLIAKKMKL